MNDKHDALRRVIGRLAKLLPLLASDKAGEVAAAANRITHVLAKEDLDWLDLVEILKEQPSSFRPNSTPFETNEEALVRIGRTANYFRDSEGAIFADLAVDGHRETWPVSSSQYSEWLTHQFWHEKEKLPSAAQIKSAVRAMRARALFSDGDRREVHLRVAESGGKIYLDIADEAWRAVEIDASGWRIVQAPPVRFRRTAGMLPLPLPERGGKIDELRAFMNVSEADFALIVAFALDTLRVGRPHPVLYLAGGEGTAKSTVTRVLGSLTDPHRLKLRNLPRVRDLFVSAYNQAVICFDNVSAIPADVSDALCQISSGSGFGKRRNYTDGEEFQITGSHAIVLNGIENCIERADLADRALIVTLPRVDGMRRRSETEFWAAFEAARPRILGALLDIAAYGLANSTRVNTSTLVRVADFQQWAVGCEGAFCEPGTFARAFAGNISDAVETLIDNEPVAKAVGAFMIGRRGWEGTAAQLLSELTNHDRTEARVARLSEWPRDAARLSKTLRRMQATLAKAGILVEFGKAIDRQRTRLVKLRNRVAEEGGGSGHGSSSNIAHAPDQADRGSEPTS